MIIDNINSCIYTCSMNTFAYDQHDSLGFMTITVNRLLNACLRRRMRDAGIDLTGEQWGVLVMLWNRGAMTQDGMAASACVDKSSMSRVLALMEEKGLVDRRVDPANARRKIVRATRAAQALQTDSLAVAREVLERALSGISAHDRAVCLNVLATVKENLRDSG